MALPQDGQDANGLTKVTQIPAGKELMFIDPTTNEGGIITLEDLTKQILNGLTSQTFGLDSGTQTLPAAINYLYGKSLKCKRFPSPSSETDILEYAYNCITMILVQSCLLILQMAIYKQISALVPVAGKAGRSLLGCKIIISFEAHI